MQITTLEFGSLFSYAPWGTSDTHFKSKTMTQMIKGDQYVSISRKVLMSDYIADSIKKNIKNLPFAIFFNTNSILVPVPTSSLMDPGSLWVTQRIANALVRKGLGKQSVECVKRVYALPKSSKSLAENRPKALDHYNSVKIEKLLVEPKEIILIDDVVTRGATLLGIANKLIEMFPNASIRGFAAMRTVTKSKEFVSINAPCVGTITLWENDTFRDP
jgi:hypothetical protein